MLLHRLLQRDGVPRRVQTTTVLSRGRTVCIRAEHGREPRACDEDVLANAGLHR